MKKTKEQIRKETPLSITSTDNPIVRIMEKGRNVEVLRTNSTDKPPSKGILYKLNKGEDYRFINKGCKLGKHFSACRLGEYDAIWIPNDCFEVTYGIVIGANTPDEVDHEAYL